MKAESKWTPEKMPGLGTRLFFTIGPKDDGSREVLSPGRLDSRSLICILDPVFRQCR
jgi:hypothetical protein